LNIAVTGATGFIGGHVVADLRRRHLKPTLLVRPGRRPGGPLAELPAVECDLKSPPADLFEQLGRPQSLIHLAWGGLPHYKSLHHFEEELPAHYAFLNGLVRSGLGACVIAGTCLEYGRQSGRLTEEDPPMPTTPYGFAKDCLRRQLEFLRTTQPFALTWARLFYTYGEGQAPTSLYPLLEAAARRGDTSFDMSDGKQVRDYLPVKEVARSIAALALVGEHAGIVNVCSGNPISVRQLVENWMRTHRWRFTLNLGRYGYPDYEPTAFWGSRDKLDALIGRAGDVPSE